jgi:U2-associated protein SR140
MYEGGLLWYPPPRLPSSLAAAGGSGDSKRSRRRSPSPSSHGTLASAGSAAQAVLAARERDTLESMLRALTAERAAIGDVMAFALDHSDKAHDVAQTIAESLTIAETLLPVKVSLREHTDFYTVYTTAAAAAAAVG